MRDLADIRTQIDQIDAQIAALFVQRMQAADDVAEYKRANGLPVLDSAREQEKLERIAAQVPPELQDAARGLFAYLMAASRERQCELLGLDSDSETV